MPDMRDLSGEPVGRLEYYAGDPQTHAVAPAPPRSAPVDLIVGEHPPFTTRLFVGGVELTDAVAAYRIEHDAASGDLPTIWLRLPLATVRGRFPAGVVLEEADGPDAGTCYRVHWGAPDPDPDERAATEIAQLQTALERTEAREAHLRQAVHNAIDDALLDMQAGQYRTAVERLTAALTEPPP